MSENDIRAILAWLERIDTKIDDKFDTTNQRISDLAEHGCAMRPIHDQQVAELRALVASRNNNGNGNGNVPFASLDWKSKKLGGIAAIIVATAIAIAIVVRCIQ